MIVERYKLTEDESSMVQELTIAITAARNAVTKVIPDIEEDKLEQYYTNAFSELGMTRLRMHLYTKEIANTHGFKYFVNFEEGYALLTNDSNGRIDRCCQEMENLDVLHNEIQLALYRNRQFTSDSDMQTYYTVATQYMASILISKRRKESTCQSLKDRS